MTVIVLAAFIVGLIVGWVLCKRWGKQVYWGRRSIEPRWGYKKIADWHMNLNYHYLCFGQYYLEMRLPHQWRKR